MSEKKNKMSSEAPELKAKVKRLEKKIDDLDRS